MNNEINKKVTLYFDDAGEWLETMNNLHKSGCSVYEVSSIVPFETADETAQEEISRLSLVGIFFAVSGIIAGLGFMVWVNTIAYPINFGGKPLLVWASFIPLVFEITVLFSVIGMVAFFLFPERKKSKKANAETAHINDGFSLVTDRENLSKIGYPNDDDSIIPLLKTEK